MQFRIVLFFPREQNAHAQRWKNILYNQLYFLVQENLCGCTRKFIYLYNYRRLLVQLRIITCVGNFHQSYK